MKITKSLLICTAILPCILLGLDTLAARMPCKSLTPCISNALNLHRPVEYLWEWQPHNSAWTKEEWTGDEKPYREVRQKIEVAAKSGTLAPLYIGYEDEAVHNPQNALAQYAWAYSMYCTPQKIPSSVCGSFTSLQWRPVIIAMDAVHSPKTYEFARVRFLVESMLFNFYEPADDFFDLTTRLLKIEPTNPEIRCYQFVYVYSLSTTYKSKRISSKEASRVTQELSKEFKKDPPQITYPLNCY